MSRDARALFQSAEEVQGAVARASTAREALHHASDEEIADALEQTFRSFESRASYLGREARSLIETSSRLSGPMIEWALGASLDRVRRPTLLELARTRPSLAPGTLSPRSLHVVVLSANVFTACVEPIVCSLLGRVPLVAKASSRDDVFARLIALAWRDAAPHLGDAFTAVTFPGGSEAQERLLFGAADAVTVYGHDSTVEAVCKRLRPDTALVPRGTGLGAAFVGREALRESAVRETLAQVALDVAAYDQRGCLSPHSIFVESDGETSPRDFAEQLANTALAELRGTLPRGPLSADEGATQMQWRGVAAVRGGLFEGDGFAVSFEGPAGARLSPGFRNVQVLQTEDVQSFMRSVRPFGRHLKALGVAGVEPAQVAAALPEGIAPRVTASGSMQTPPLDAFADGGSRWDGLFAASDRPRQR
jgi:acyl-CoA reductase-like NAD-dependent aldehyde dehydrogenase